MDNTSQPGDTAETIDLAWSDRLIDPFAPVSRVEARLIELTGADPADIYERSESPGRMRADVVYDRQRLD